MPSPLVDRLTGPLRQSVQMWTARSALAALYPGVIVSDNGDGTVDFKADDTVNVPSVKRVPLRQGNAGDGGVVLPNSRSFLFFEGARPDSPAVGLFGVNQADVVALVAQTLIKLQGPGYAGEPVGRVGDAVQVTISANAFTGPTALAVVGASATGPAAAVTVSGVITAGAPGVKA